jgi:hypothetical protein
MRWKVVRFEGNSRRSDTTFPPCFSCYVGRMAPVRTVQVLKGGGLGGGGRACEDRVRADHCLSEDGVGVGDSVDGTVSAPVEEVGVVQRFH